MLDFASFVTVLLLACAALLLLVSMLYPTQVLRWLQRKRYQYEVTFSLYMLTPTEKFIFNSFLFLLISMIIIAASLYLPEHVATIANRVFYYWAGDDAYYTPFTSKARDVLPTAINNVFGAMRGAAQGGAQQAAAQADRGL